MGEFKMIWKLLFPSIR